ncbi:hypothetical protein BN6_42300 [Saccharothrix espanaensis DSM 44229]|uniref:YbaB/EbfC DNA-binding family protein n=2 Tax=Saccharothrix espanaensis TaxID=103731 RepID=K0K1S5_SACES|nr:hypothetical protein BN6_42300 [Saccharothrix espanaensis DSM 44229]
MRQLARVQEYAATVRELLDGARAHAPTRAEGADGSGTVHVVLGPDGLPTSFRVDTGWDRRITPAGFGGAVLEAFQAAVADRMETWTRSMAADGWQQRADRVDAAATGRIPPALRAPVPEVAPRPLGEVVEDALKAFDDVDAFAGLPTSGGATGADRSGKLTVTLSPTGLTSCTADERWVGAQSAASLMNALGEALAAARRGLADLPAPPASTGPLDRLFGEAMALLSDPRKLAD